MAKHTQKIFRQNLTNSLSVFDHFVGLAFKGLISEISTNGSQRMADLQSCYFNQNIINAYANIVGRLWKWK